MATRVLVLCVLLLSASPAFADTIVFNAFLSGGAESPPNASPATGSAFVSFDTVTHMMFVSATFSGLVGNTMAAHIHCCVPPPFTGTAGVATQTPSFPGFPLGVTAGSFSNTYDMTLASSYNTAFINANGGNVASAEAALIGGMVAGATYFNIHTTVFPGGEIRGFLSVPEPSTVVFLGVGLLVLCLGYKRVSALA
jgi:hypothetical protein